MNPERQRLLSFKSPMLNLLSAMEESDFFGSGNIWFLLLLSLLRGSGLPPPFLAFLSLRISQITFGVFPIAIGRFSHLLSKGTGTMIFWTFYTSVSQFVEFGLLAETLVAEELDTLIIKLGMPVMLFDLFILSLGFKTLITQIGRSVIEQTPSLWRSSMYGGHGRFLVLSTSTLPLIHCTLCLETSLSIHILYFVQSSGYRCKTPHLR